MQKNSIQKKFFTILLAILIIVLYVPSQTIAATSDQKTISSTGNIQYPTDPPPPNSETYFGWSSYPRTQSGTYTTQAIDQIIQTMNDNGLNIYRMAFNDFRDVETLVIPYVQYFLDNCDYDVIVDYYHQYPMDALSSSQLSETIKGLGLET